MIICLILKIVESGTIYHNQEIRIILFSNTFASLKKYTHFKNA